MVGPYLIWVIWFPSSLPLETPTVAPERFVERVARAGHSTVGRIGTHVLLRAPPQASASRLWG
jgi:hypothetical protein